MKTKILLALAIFALSCSLTGQTNKYKFQVRSQRSDSGLTNSFYYNNISNDFNLNKRPGINRQVL